MYVDTAKFVDESAKSRRFLEQPSDDRQIEDVTVPVVLCSHPSAFVLTLFLFVSE